MPVKVRCPSCKKVLNAPDAARGKAIKCPQCEGKVRVPAGKGAVPAAKAKKKEDAPVKAAVDHDDFLANLSLKNIEDTSVRVCPKCGAEAKEEETVCAKCGIDLGTGKLSEAARKKQEKLRLKGPDPDEFYKNAWKDPWAFIRGNQKLVLRTIVYWLILTSLAGVCGYMVLWCHRTPPKAFWGFCGFVSLMVAPGWTWFLHTTVIDAALEKKDKLKRVNFDFFLCAALGIKFFVWQSVYLLPFILIGWLLFKFAGLIAALVIVSLGELVALATFPIVMAHMSMPVTYRGWILPVVVQVFFKTTAQSLYWGLIFIVTNIPVIAGLVVIAAVYGNELAGFVDTLRFNATVAVAAGTEAPKPEKNAEGKEVPVVDPLAQFRGVEKKELNARPLIVPGVIWLFVCVFFGFSSVFNMRSNGQFAWYFKRHLDLIGEVKQIVYKPKEVDEAGDPIVDPKKERQKKIATGVVVVILLFVAANFGLHFFSGGKYLLIPSFLARLLGIIE